MSCSLGVLRHYSSSLRCSVGHNAGKGGTRGFLRRNRTRRDKGREPAGKGSCQVRLCHPSSPTLPARVCRASRIGRGEQHRAFQRVCVSESQVVTIHHPILRLHGKHAGDQHCKVTDHISAKSAGLKKIPGIMNKVSEGSSAPGKHLQSQRKAPKTKLV